MASEAPLKSHSLDAHKQKKRFERDFKEIGRWEHDAHSEADIDGFIRRELQVINDSASLSIIPGAHKGRDGRWGLFHTGNTWLTNNGSIFNLMLRCPLWERCDCRCEAKLVRSSTTTILFVSHPHSLEDHAKDKDKGAYLSYQEKIFVKKAVQMAPMQSAGDLLRNIKGSQEAIDFTLKNSVQYQIRKERRGKRDFLLEVDDTLGSPLPLPPPPERLLTLLSLQVRRRCCRRVQKLRVPTRPPRPKVSNVLPLYASALAPSSTPSSNPSLPLLPPYPPSSRPLLPPPCFFAFLPPPPPPQPAFPFLPPSSPPSFLPPSPFLQPQEGRLGPTKAKARGEQGPISHQPCHGRWRIPLPLPSTDAGYVCIASRMEDISSPPSYSSRWRVPASSEVARCRMPRLACRASSRPRSGPAEVPAGLHPSRTRQPRRTEVPTCSFRKPPGAQRRRRRRRRRTARRNSFGSRPGPQSRGVMPQRRSG